MDGKIWLAAARVALPSIVALALGVPALGQAETPAPGVITETAALVAERSAGGLLASEPAGFAADFKPFTGDLPAIVLPTYAVDVSTIDSPEPEVQDLGSGIASFYGRRFAGRPTASGERFDPAALTAAHRTLPFGSKVRVTNQRNGQSVVVRINDRGPFSRGRHIDLSPRAAEQIGIVAAGHGTVELELLAG